MGLQRLEHCSFRFCSEKGHSVYLVVNSDILLHLHFYSLISMPNHEKFARCIHSEAATKVLTMIVPKWTDWRHDIAL